MRPQLPAARIKLSEKKTDTSARDVTVLSNVGNVAVTSGVSRVGM